MLTCRDLVFFIADYLSNELGEAERVAFESHLARCLHCTKYLQSYRMTIKLSRAAFSNLDGPVPEDVPEELIQAVLSVRQLKAGVK